MDTIRIAAAHTNETTDQPAIAPAEAQRPERGVRSLADWELLLVGGGDFEPEWP